MLNRLEHVRNPFIGYQSALRPQTCAVLARTSERRKVASEFAASV